VLQRVEEPKIADDIDIDQLLISTYQQLNHTGDANE